MRKRVLAREERRLEVHVEEEVKGVRVGLLDGGPPAPRPRDVGEVVEAPVVFDDVRNHALDVGLVGEVALVEVDAFAGVELGVLVVRGDEVRRGDGRASVREGFADRASERPAGSGHECDASVEVETDVHTGSRSGKPIKPGAVQRDERGGNRLVRGVDIQILLKTFKFLSLDTFLIF
jgi:hypothetical protein